MTFAKKVAKVKTVFGKDRDVLHILEFHGAKDFFFFNSWENMQPSHSQVLRFSPYTGKCLSDVGFKN